MKDWGIFEWGLAAIVFVAVAEELIGYARGNPPDSSGCHMNVRVSAETKDAGAEAGGTSALWLGDASLTSSNYVLTSDVRSCIIGDGHGGELRRYDCHDPARFACFTECGRRFASMPGVDWDAAIPPLLACTDDCARIDAGATWRAAP